jgi:hypothetical protein
VGCGVLAKRARRGCCDRPCLTLASRLRPVCCCSCSCCSCSCCSCCRSFVGHQGEQHGFEAINRLLACDVSSSLQRLNLLSHESVIPRYAPHDNMGHRTARFKLGWLRGCMQLQHLTALLVPTGEVSSSSSTAHLHSDEAEQRAQTGVLNPNICVAACSPLQDVSDVAGQLKSLSAVLDPPSCALLAEVAAAGTGLTALTLIDAGVSCQA